MTLIKQFYAAQPGSKNCWISVIFVCNPSLTSIASRYVFTPLIFDYLDTTQRGKNNEIQLTDAMRQMVKEQAMYGLQFDGVRYDIGNKLDFIKTNLIYGLEHEEIGAKLRKWLLEYTTGMK